MGVLEIIGGIVMILLSIGIIVMVLMQESPKGNNISALTGGDSYFNKNQGRTIDALLFRGTKIAAVLFFVVTLLVYAVNVYMG